MEDVSNVEKDEDDKTKLDSEEQIKIDDINLIQQSSENHSSNKINSDELSASETNIKNSIEIEEKSSQDNEANKLEENYNLNDFNQSDKTRKSTPSPTSNCILFYGVTYLGCSSVNAPKSESEINRVMSTLNEQGQLCVEVTMSVPQSIEEKIILYDSSNMDSKMGEYKMAQVLFVVRGNKNSPEGSCFAFTTCHGDSTENFIFSCHVFRCNTPEAVSKILYSFWTVFNRQSQQNQQQLQQQQQQLQHKKSNESSSISLVSSTTGQLSSVASSLLGSLYGLQSSSFSNVSNSSNNSSNSNNNFVSFCDFACKFVNGKKEDQYVFRAVLDIKEEDPKNPSNFISVPKEKEFFKFRKNLQKQINIKIYQLTNQPLEIERCFGLLMCQGRNVSHKDMQLLHTISMGKTGFDSNNPNSNIHLSKTNNSNSSTNSNNNNLSNLSTYTYNTGYVVSALWNPLDTTVSTSLQVLNEETQKNARVFLTIAVDLVINGLQDPVRFCIETKARVYSQNEKFWVYQKNKHFEEFFVQIVKYNRESTDAQPKLSSSNHIYSLHSIHSLTELLRKKHANEHTNSTTSNNSVSTKEGNQNQSNNTVSDDESELVMSGLGNVSKDCPEEELLDWSDILSKWRKATWNERPRGLQSLVRKGIPEALRGEVWQLLAGCNENEKTMNESYRLLLSKESNSESVIIRDINRTFPGHQFFQDESGQQSLYKLSKAYSIYDEEVGYCQGLSFLIASLLLHMPEEQAFNLLVKIMYKYELREIYKTNFECLHLRFYQLESLIRELLPELYEHFVDLNIETHMYASQWFLTLYTAKFPLYMVFRILDLFLCEGFMVIFSIALTLLKASQRDLLALDFEGVLKYFRVNLPKKYRNEQSFNHFMYLWVSLHSKLNDKKLKKLEKNYKQMKEAEALKEDPLIRYEKECKRLTQLLRRLEQENDDLANEYIDSKIALSKQIEEQKDDYEIVKTELIKYKTDYQNKLNESFDTNKKLMSELDQIKQLWRKQAEKYESELERNIIIINEYKQICNSLSSKVEKWTAFKKKYESRNRKLDLCENCIEKNKLEDEPNETASTNNDNNEYSTKSETNLSSPATSSEDTESLPDNEVFSVDENNKFHLNENHEAINENLIESNINNNNKENNQLIKIKKLELELARVKLELVDAQCKNQEFDHLLKGYLNSNSNNVSNEQNKTNNIMRSNSTASQDTNTSNQVSMMSASLTSLSSQMGHTISSNSNASNSTLNNPNSNNWLSKTFTQFKEATNQVVQKAQKATK